MPGFDPNYAMLKAYVSKLELRPTFDLMSISRENTLTSAMIYAFYASKVTNNLDMSLVERLQRLFPPPIQPKIIPFFVQLAVYYGLFTYVEYFLGLRRNRPKPELTHLLGWALSPPELVTQYPCSLEVVSLLLKHGADPNKRLQSQDTPWESALYYLWQRTEIRVRHGLEPVGPKDPFAREWMEILKILVLSGADPNPFLFNADGRKSAFEIITTTFKQALPSETTELVQLLELRGGRHTIRKRQQLSLHLNKFLPANLRAQGNSRWTS
jgi:hypothetical protein